MKQVETQQIKKVKSNANEKSILSSYFERLDRKQQEYLEHIIHCFDKYLTNLQCLNKESEETIKKLLESVSLYKEGTPLYMYSEEEFNPSCRRVSCAFGSTFPQNKYDQHLAMLKKPSDIHPILVLSEAAGTGKTHIAYHISKTSDEIVLLVTLRLTSSLRSCLERKSRTNMDEMARVFFSNYISFGTLLYEHAKESKVKDPGMCLIRFMFNEGSDLIGQCDTFLQDLGPKEMKRTVYFMMDEVQLFDTQDLKVPHCQYSKNSEPGNAITLYSSSLRKLAPIIMTTTFLKRVKTKLEELTSSNALNESILVYSYDFSSTLPVIHSTQVLCFLGQFIKIETNDIWKNVPYFIQGPFRRCEQFLQNLIITLEGIPPSEDRALIAFNELIYTVLNSVVSSYFDLAQQVEESTNTQVADSFLKLAVFKEVKFNSLEAIEVQQFSKYLLTNSISFSHDYSNKIFQVTSPIDQLLLFNTLKQLAKQKDQDWLTYSYEKLCDSENRTKLTEIVLIYYLLNNFKDILSEFSGSYLDEYAFQATYFIKEIPLSTAYPNVLDIRATSLLLNAITSDNSNSIINSNGYKDDTFTKVLIIPSDDTGPGLLGVLFSRGNKSSSKIPLISAVTLLSTKEEFIKTYNSTNPCNMYSQSFEMENNPSLTQEKKQIIDSITNIVDNKRMLRILFHPNAQFSNTLEERIPEYSEHADTGVKSFSDHAVMTDKGHLIYEISGCNSKWQQFTKQFPWMQDFLNSK